MRKLLLLLTLLGILAMPAAPARAQNPHLKAAGQPGVVTDAYSMIAEVNALRAANGLAAYNVNPILMSVAQTHAEYMASIRTVTHYDANGLRPYQRGLAAGYPLAGDLSLGGFYSENIMAGNNLSVQEAVQAWQGDTPHLQTMLAPGLQEIGAGVALVGDYVYYVIDCARPTGSGQPQSYTPGLGVATDVPLDATAVFSPPLARTIIPNTPETDGKLYHVVGPGETLWLIAITYGVKIADIRRLNHMAEADAIYPRQKLLVRDSPAAEAGATDTALAADTTPTTPTVTAPPTFTPVPTWTPQPSSTPVPPTPVPVAPVSSGSSMLVLGIIIVAALILAGVFVRAGQRAA